MSRQPEFPTLTAEEMRGVAITFQESVTHTLAAFPSSDHLPKIVEYLAQLATLYQPVRLASEDGRSKLALEIFGQPALSEFFTRLTSVFYSRMGSNDEIERLIGNLARGASLFIPEHVAGNNPGDPTKFSLIPRELTMRFSSTTDLIESLRNNAWMVSVLCVCLYINLTQLQKA